jgi:hypothetical protein
MPFTDVIEHLIKALKGIEMKTTKREDDNGYDSDITADLTSDDSNEEEMHQIKQATFAYRYTFQPQLASPSHRCALESLRGCYTGKIYGSSMAGEAVEKLDKASLYSKNVVPRF